MLTRSPKSQPKLNTKVQVFSNLVEMRFKPQNQNGAKALIKRRQKLVKANKQYLDIYDPLSMVLYADRKIEAEQSRRLKFIASLSADHFIVGNENQIDLISYGAIAHGFVDTDYYWSLNLRTPIESITVDAKKCIFILLSDSIAYFYRYSTKNKELPVIVTQITLNERVRFIRFLKDMLLGFFYTSRYEIYNIENLNAIKKKLDKPYQITKEKKLLTIPPSIDNIINVFFQEAKESKQSFILWCLQINFQGEQIRTRELYRVYDIMNYVKGKLSIQNYTKDIIFMNLKNQIMAIKNGYLIDTVNVSVNQEGEILKYIHPQTILHITKRNVEVYNFSINMAVKPEKIVLRSVDSIEIPNIPQNAFYISVLQTSNSNFAIFFQDSQKKRYQSRGQISYYFQISQSTTLKQKINSLFESISQGMSNPESLEEKYNMAKKMGLSQREIYLQIWNRSHKSSLEDYQYILATRDYKTIKMEIEKKLKKESMVLREILRIQQGCFDINRQKIEDLNPTQEDFQDYVTSKFLMRKLKLYRQINVIQKIASIIHSQDSTGQGKSLKIDIQQYYFFKNADVKSFLVDQISDMLFNFKNNAKIIRIIIKHFKFTYRIIYKDLLQEIIKVSKDEIMNLLNEIPQILPYLHRDLNQNEHKSGLFDGIWGEINPDQWDDALIPAQVENIHNKEVLAEFVNSIWFKRYWLTSHDMINKTKEQILSINQINNSEKIFYFFIAKIYELTKNNKALYYQIVNFLQEKYELFPFHLRNKSFLYENLYIYYYHEEISNSNRLTFTQFLQQDDQHIFKYFFDHEKVKKNSLLKEIKPIYQQSDPNGSHIFNIGLFSYFYSNLSKISDLKFILNRINNQKTEFHQKNFGIYEVLVKSMQLKMKLGGQDNIPMDQVMIYIQNIPLDKNNQIMLELFVMEKIKEQAERFNQMKLNMSVKKIMDQCDLVIGRIVCHQIMKRKVMQIEDWNFFRQQTFNILEDVQGVRRKIYNNGESNFALLVYLCFILQNENMVDKVAHLLQDDRLHQLYIIEETTVQNIVFYMYKWTLCRSTTYLSNQSYLKKLLELLPQQNQCRVYLQSELDLATMLSSQEVPIYFPIGKTTVCPNVNDVKQIFKYMKKQQLMEIIPLIIYQLLSKLQKVTADPAIKEEEKVSLHKIYEIYLVEILERKLFIQSIPHIYRILQLQCPIKDGAIIYVMLFVFKIADDFNEESKRIIFKLVALLFFEPASILKIIEFSIKTKLTGLEQTRHLRDILMKESNQKYNFNTKNPILSNYFCQNYKRPTTKQAIQYYRTNLKASRQDLQRINEYDLIFTILCQSPYLLVKFIDLQKDHIQMKTLKSFLLAIGYREIFHPLRTFQLFKRVFAVLTIGSKQGKDPSLVVEPFRNRSIQEEYLLPKLTKLTELEKQYFKSASLYSKHYTIIKTKFENQQSGQSYRKKRVEKLKQIVQNPNIITFDNAEVQELQQENKVTKQKLQPILKEVKPGNICFDVVNQRKSIFKRTLPFKQFIKGQLITKSEEIAEDAQKKEPKLLEKKAKVSNYLRLRNSMIQQLYSHKVVNKSEYNDEYENRKQDEAFLDGFLPKKMDLGDSKIQLQRKQSKQSLLESKLSLRNNSLNEIDKQKQVLELVKVIDNELQAEHNIQIGNYNNIQPEAQDANILYSRLAQRVIATYNENRIPRFDLMLLNESLQNIIDQNNDDQAQSHNSRVQFLYNFVKFIYYKSIQKTIDLKLIQEIARKHPQSGINIFFLQAYERIYATHQKYGLDLDIASILPITAIFTKSKDIFDLYIQVEPYILPKINDQNLFKISKLIALGFRKNIVEQQILVKYSKLMMLKFLKTSEQQKMQQFEKIRAIWQKLQAPVLVQKTQMLFEDIERGQRRQFLLSSLLESLKNKGYVSASRDLASKLV